LIPHNSLILRSAKLAKRTVLVIWLCKSNRMSCGAVGVEWGMAYVSLKQPTSPIQAGDFLIRPKSSGWGVHYGRGVGDGIGAHTTPEAAKHIGDHDEFFQGMPGWIIRPVLTDQERMAVVMRTLSDLGRPYDALAAGNCEDDVLGYSPTRNFVLLVAAGVILWKAFTPDKPKRRKAQKRTPRYS
jgi:hypothetical protein